MAKRDQLMLEMDKLTASLFNVIQWVKYQFLFNKKLLIKNDELRVSDETKEMCFIIGTGPSLKNVDLTLIEAFPCFTVNFFYKGVEKFVSDYHILVDPGFNKNANFEYIRQLYLKNNHTQVILGDILYNRILKENLLDDRTYCIRPAYVQYGNKINCNMQKGMTGALNVIPIAIECAIFMGYKTICLLGCDFNSYAVSKDEHFYDAPGYENRMKEKNIIGELIRCALVHKHHFALELYSKNHGIKIYNLTEGSLINAYEKDTLSHILQTYHKPL